MPDHLSFTDIPSDILRTLFDTWLSGPDLMMLVAAQTPASDMIQTPQLSIFLLIAIAHQSQNIFRSGFFERGHPTLSVFASRSTFFQEFAQSDCPELTQLREKRFKELLEQGYMNAMDLLDKLMFLTRGKVNTKHSEMALIRPGPYHPLLKILLGEIYAPLWLARHNATSLSPSRTKKPNKYNKLLNQILNDDPIKRETDIDLSTDELSDFVDHIRDKMLCKLHTRKLITPPDYSPQKVSRVIRFLVLNIDNTMYESITLEVINQLLHLLEINCISELEINDISEFEEPLLNMCDSKDSLTRVKIVHIAVTLIFIYYKTGNLRKKEIVENILLEMLSDTDYAVLDAMIELISILESATILQWTEHMLVLPFDKFDKQIPQIFAQMMTAPRAKDLQPWKKNLLDKLNDQRVLERWKAIRIINELILTLKPNDPQKLEWIQPILGVILDSRNTPLPSDNNDISWYKKNLHQIALEGLSKLLATIETKAWQSIDSAPILNLCRHPDFVSSLEILCILSACIFNIESADEVSPFIDTGLSLIRGKAVQHLGNAPFIASLISRACAWNTHTPEEIYKWIKPHFGKENLMYHSVTTINFATFISRLTDRAPKKAKRLIKELIERFSIIENDALKTLPQAFELLFKSEPEKARQLLEPCFETLHHASAEDILSRFSLTSSFYGSTIGTTLKELLFVLAKHMTLERLNTLVQKLTPYLNYYDESIRTNILDILGMIILHRPEQRTHLNTLKNRNAEIFTLKKMALMHPHLPKLANTHTDGEQDVSTSQSSNYRQG